EPVVPQTPREQFVAPTDTAQPLPEVEIDEETGDTEADGGVVGGVEGGVEGGVVGGVVGGVIGGVVGGVLGGTLGGVGDQPLRVGGNVKPPEVVFRVEPNYTEGARRARVQGVVILEAIIDANGNVSEVRVLKPLAEGLGDEAVKAVRQWKFRPGTQNGRPVPVIFSLTVNFRLQ
ncbi:MAG: energy transducer TonB, partial [Thermoanaerobaculia bacterium]